MDATAPSYISLFSGCGGLDAGMASLGWRCVAHVEKEQDCVAVLEQRFPGVPNLGDITKVDWSQAPQADGIAGGFPCQDMSYAGRGAGLEGERSALWFDMMDAIRAVKPKRVLIENVPGLLGRGLHVVTHNLAAAGYVGAWRTLAAADIGAPHRRERVFIVARLSEAPTEIAGQATLLANFTPDGWESPQITLLGNELLDHLPKAGAWNDERIYEFAIPESDADVLLLPTPNASESTPTDEFVDEMRAAGIQPDARLYLPGRKWFAQRTLSRVAATLLPTPNAWLGRRPENATADPERAKSREHDGTRGKRSIELPDALAEGVKLLPTPTSSHRGDRSEASKDAGGGDELRAVRKLLPTPTAGDGKSAGSRNLEGSKAHDGVSLTDAIQYGDSSTPRLLPTPVANPENPGAGGELRAALHHGPERRTDSDTDKFGRPITKGRDRDVTLLPTPRVEASRSSRKALVENQQWSAPSLEQAVEIAQGVLPREFDSWEQVKGKDRPTSETVNVEWGAYEPAIRRWESILGRPAPLPTDEKGRLSPAFVEWMLGFPEDWVHIDGARRTSQLRMLGNAVQIQCAQVAALWLAELGALS